MRVSVIIPCYNYGRFLPEAVASVQAQTMADLEVIVVDDGSTDETPTVLAGIHDSRVRTIRIANSGISGARNAGLDLATGEFIAFLDADDRWVPEKLERQVRLLDQEPSVGMVFSNFSRFDESGTFPKTQFDFIPELANIPTRPAPDGGRVIRDDPFARLIGLGQFATWLQTVIIRRSLVADLRFPARHVVNEDLHYMARVYLRTRAAFFEEPLTEVRRHGDNSYRAAWEKLEPDPVALRSLLDEPLTPAQRRALLRRIGRAWSAVAYHHLWFGGAKASAKASLQALRYPGARLRALRRLALLPIRRLLPPRTPPS